MSVWSWVRMELSSLDKVIIITIITIIIIIIIIIIAN